MAQTSGRVEDVAPATFTAAGYRYRIADKRLFFDGGSVTLDFFIGSNSAGRSYLWQRDGYMFEVPVTWYSRKQIWDASPGYENDSEIRLTRPIEPNCFWCHSSQARPVWGTQNRYGGPPFLENGVSCERCHGPGSEHVKTPGKSTIVNPARLDPERRDAICSQCHLTGAARVERPGRRLVEFRAGDLLSEYVTYFVWKQGGDDFKVTSHVERLAASACKTASGEALSCAACHEPHTNADNSQAACLGCHQAAHRQEQRCASCHMPKIRAVDANHGVMTDHRIPRKWSDVKDGKDGGHGTLVPFLGTADDRSLGLAYAEIGDPRAQAYLLRGRPQDSQVRLRLAVLQADPLRAIKFYESVLQDDQHETVALINLAALVNLGALYAQSGRTTEAGRLWDRALEMNPATEEAVLNLTYIRPAAESRIILMRYLELNPVSRKALARLAALPK
jgi:hypothetical protein